MKLKGYEKAAILLSSLDAELLSKIFEEMHPGDIGKIFSYIARTRINDSVETEAVFKEIYEKIGFDKIPSDKNAEGHSDIAKCICNENDDTDKIIETASKESPLASLKWVDARTFSSFLESEHPQTIALIICLLETEQAAEILELLPEEMRSDVTIRIAETTQIPESAVEVVEAVLTSQLNLVNEGEHQSFKGIKAIAEILKHCDRKVEQNILEKVDSCNTELASEIKELILTFKDIEKIDDRGIDLLLKNINTEEMSIALRTASDNIQDKFMSNMSEKAAKILKEKMELKGPVKLSDVEKAQQNIVGAMKKLDEEGKIIISGRSKEKIVL